MEDVVKNELNYRMKQIKELAALAIELNISLEELYLKIKT